MKAVFVFLIVFLWVSSVYAQDLIVLRDGNIIEAKVTEITPSEIKYKRFDNLNGPTIVIAKADVLSIRYENRSVEIITPVSPAGQQNAQANRPNAATGQGRSPPKPQTALDPNELTISINASPAGLLLYGPSVCLELGKGKFNSEINLIFPFGLAGSSGKGFGGLATFNGFWHRSNGGFYLGGGIGYVFQKDYYFKTNSFRWWGYDDSRNAHFILLGLNLGYKFVLSSGLYFRTGAFLGVQGDPGFLYNFDNRHSSPVRFYAKPDLTIGYVF